MVAKPENVLQVKSSEIKDEALPRRNAIAMHLSTSNKMDFFEADAEILNLAFYSAESHLF